MRIKRHHFGATRSFKVTNTPISIFPNAKDDFFDGWMKHAGNDVDCLGINECGARYVIIHHDFYYCVEDIVNYFKKYDVEVDYLDQAFPHISAEQRKDVWKELS